MSNIIDLSQTIENKMLVFPGDDQVRVYEDKKLSTDDYCNTRLEAGMHTGTHIDAPRHFIDSDKFISEFSLERFIGKGCLLDVRGQKTIQVKKEYQEKVQKGDIVLLYTGVSEKFGQHSYYSELEKQPKVSMGLAKFLLEKEIKMLGLDMATPDLYPFEIHKTLMEKDIFIMENLTNLDQLLYAQEFEVIALPLKIKAEGSLVRAIARIIK